jgi:hypothetical protein
VQVKKEGVETELAGLEEKNKLLEAAYEKLRFEFESEISDHQENKIENVKLREQLDRKKRLIKFLSSRLRPVKQV